MVASRSLHLFLALLEGLATDARLAFIGALVRLLAHTPGPLAGWAHMLASHDLERAAAGRA